MVLFSLLIYGKPVKIGFGKKGGGEGEQEVFLMALLERK